MRRQENRHGSLKHFFKRNGRRIAVFTCGIYLVHIVAPVYYAKLQAELYMTVSGKVVDGETGQGIRKGTVILLEIKGGQLTERQDFARTDKDGTYVFTMVPLGEYHLFAFPPKDSNYAVDLTPRIVSVVRGKNVNKVDFQLDIGGVVTGIVLGKETNQPKI